MKIAYLLFVLCINLFLSSCVDLTGRSGSFEKKAHNTSGSREKLADVHTMLGGLGIFSVGMHQLRDICATQFDVESSSSMWYNAGHVTKSIEAYYYAHNPRRPIILMGHSLGGNEQIQVARNLNRRGIPVALLVTIDAVSQSIVPPNVKEALNIYKPGVVPMFSGLKLRAKDPTRTHVVNINVATLPGKEVNHFTIDKDPRVQAMIIDKVKEVLRNANS